MNNFKKHCFKTILKLSVLGFISFNHFLHANYEYMSMKPDGEEFANYEQTKNPTIIAILNPVLATSITAVEKKRIKLQQKIIDALTKVNSKSINRQNFINYRYTILGSQEMPQSFENLFFNYENDIYTNCETLDSDTKTYIIPFTHEDTSIKAVSVIFGEGWGQEYGFALKVTMAVAYNLETIYNEELSSDDICKIYDGIVEKLDIFAKGMHFVNNKKTPPQFENLYIHSNITNSDSLINQLNKKTRIIRKGLSTWNPFKGAHKGQDVDVVIRGNIKLTISIAGNQSFDVNIKISRTKTDQNTTGIILNRMYLWDSISEEDIKNFGTRIKKITGLIPEVIPNDLAKEKVTLDTFILDVVNTYLWKGNYAIQGCIISSYFNENLESPDEVKKPHIILIKPRYVDFSTLLDPNLGDATIDHHISNKRNIFLHFAVPLYNKTDEDKKNNKTDQDQKTITSYVVGYSVIKNFGNWKKVDQFVKRNIKPFAGIGKLAESMFHNDTYNHDKRFNESDGIVYEDQFNKFSYDLGYAEKPYSYENTLYISKISKEKYDKTLKTLSSMYKAKNKDKAVKIFDNYFFFQIK